MEILSCPICNSTLSTDYCNGCKTNLKGYGLLLSLTKESFKPKDMSEVTARPTSRWHAYALGLAIIVFGTLALIITLGNIDTTSKIAPISARANTQSRGLEPENRTSINDDHDVVPYLIQKGDTLSNIASKRTQYATVEDILDLNPWLKPTPNILHVGEYLILPKRSS